MKSPVILLLLAFGVYVLPSWAFIGMGITMYQPSCAYACRAAIKGAPLTCSEENEPDGAVTTTPECRAENLPFLTTLAYCMNTTCLDANVETWFLEKYWRESATGDKAVAPMWTYSQTYSQIDEPPIHELDPEVTLNTTAIVQEADWLSQKLTLEHFEEQETTHARSGLILLVVGFATPILFTLIGYLPYMSSLYERLSFHLVYPSTVGTYHVRALPYMLGNPPLVGQALYVAMFTVLNIIVTSINYNSTQPNTWFASTWEEVVAYISARTGVLAFALAPLTVLLAGRNNILLWLTNWSHSTFMVLHRWVARLLVIQIVLHSIIELVLYEEMGVFEEETVKPYWIWGIVATLTSCIMLVISTVYFRRLAYEIFLILHILLAAFTLIGSWYHVEFLFTRKWGYEIWLYAAFAVWFFDRLIRVLRIAKVGILHSHVTDLGGDVVRVDVPSVRWSIHPGSHAYVYLPTLKPIAPWENHPFSIIQTQMLHGPTVSPLDKRDSTSQTRTSSGTSDLEKAGEQGGSSTTTAGVTFYVKKFAGITKYLKTTDKLLTLLEGPYHSNSVSSVLKCDRLVLIGGGIGVTALLPFTKAHPNVKLYWSLKKSSEPLARDLDTILTGLAEKDVKIGERFDVDSILEDEDHSGWEKIGVVICGPDSLCDDAREAVVRIGKRAKSRFVLDVEAFSW